jgi:hypothetical protein
MTVVGLVGAAVLVAFAAFAFAGVLLLLKAILWLLILPFRLIGWLLMLPFLLLKAVFAGITLAFVIGLLTILGVAALVAFTVAALIPLLPLLLVGLVVWLIVGKGSPLHRASTARS